MKKINKPTDDAVVISCQLIDQIRKQGGKNWADLMALYAFYYRCGKRQKTNQPWVTNFFASEGLRWGADKLKTRKAALKSLGLIDVYKKIRKDGKVAKWYVQVAYMWGQSHTEETPEDNTTTSVISQQVANSQQMLKVNKTKCLNLIRKEERRKGDSTIPKNSNNTDAKIQPSSSLVNTVASSSVGTPEVLTISKHPENVQTGEVSSLVTPSASSAKGNKPEVSSREKYIQLMKKRFDDLCGLDGVHILQADLASNTRRSNWNDQFDYWEKRLSDIDEHQAEAWRLIAAYLRVFYSSNGYYPDMRNFLRGWRAIGWKEEKTRIFSYCKTHDGVLNLRNYVEKRAEEGQVVIAKWLLSSSDYSRWFMRLEKENDGGGYSSDDFDNRPSARPQTMSEWEECHAKGMRKTEQEQRKRVVSDLTERASTLLRLNPKSMEIVPKIRETLQLYKDRGDLDKFKQSVEALESSQASREVPTGGKT
jgi:hypothetical protein